MVRILKDKIQSAVCPHVGVPDFDRLFLLETGDWVLCCAKSKMTGTIILLPLEAAPLHWQKRITTGSGGRHTAGHL